jgi:hypothetical protein
MDKLSETNHPFKTEKSVGWIYWVDLSKLKRALVIDDIGGNILKGLKNYFNKVDLISINEIYKLYETNEISDKRIYQYDLIYFSDSLNKKIIDKNQWDLIVKNIYSIMSDNGQLVFFQTMKNILSNVIINAIFGGSIDKRKSNSKTAKNIKYLNYNLRKSKGFYLADFLFLHFDCDQSFTIWNSKLYMDGIFNWRKGRSIRAKLINILFSKYFLCISKRLWPNKIKVMRKVKSKNVI